MKKSVVRKLASWKTEKGQESKMACYLIDALFIRKNILQYTLDDLIEKEKNKMDFIFSYIKSYFKFKDGEDRSYKKAIQDKLSHFPGRQKEPKRAKISSESNETSNTESNSQVQTVTTESNTEIETVSITTQSNTQTENVDTE